MQLDEIVPRANAPARVVFVRLRPSLEGGEAFVARPPRLCHCAYYDPER